MSLSTAELVKRQGDHVRSWIGENRLEVMFRPLTSAPWSAMRLVEAWCVERDLSLGRPQWFCPQGVAPEHVAQWRDLEPDRRRRLYAIVEWSAPDDDPRQATARIYVRTTPIPAKQRPDAQLSLLEAAR